MIIRFATLELKHECNNLELLVKRLGARRARLLRQRLDELFNASVLEDMRCMPHVAFLVPGGSALLALDLGFPYRLELRPEAKSAPTNEISGWDWKKIDSILITGLIRAEQGNPAGR